MTAKIPLKRTDPLELLYPIWVMACNDENPIMTYKSITYRLGLPDDYPLLTLVKAHPELFRHGVPAYRLEEWKENMRQGRGIPRWIVDMANHDDRLKAIDGLTRDSAFRSQFRIERDAEKTPLDVMKWGLEHIDRLRKGHSEQKEFKLRSWQLYTTIIIGLLTLIVSLFNLYLKK